MVQTLQSWPQAVTRKPLFAGGCDWGANNKRTRLDQVNAGVLEHDDNGMGRLTKQDEYSKYAV